MQEFDLIKKYFLPLTNGLEAALGLEDDVALIPSARFALSGKNLVVSKDIIAENVHFRLADGGFNIGCKLLASNLSDLAASGAKPLYYMLGFGFNEKIDEKFVADFCRGLKATGDEHQISLIGGDSIKNKGNLVFSVTIFGEVTKNKLLRRNSAVEKEAIFVSGTIGDAYLALFLEQNKEISEKSKQYLLSRLHQPSARISLAQELLRQKLSRTAIDISDGLLADLRHICDASKVSASVNLDDVPLSDAAKEFLCYSSTVNLTDLLAGGDDYELLFTVPEKNCAKIIELSRQLNVPLTRIGSITKRDPQKPVILLNKNSHEVPIGKYGYSH